MPSSSSMLNIPMRELLTNFVQSGFTQFMDVGSGSGKYGKILREIETATRTKLFLRAIELDASYISKYKTETLYDKVHNLSIQKFLRNNPRFCVQIVILGDILEHIPKSQGIDILENLLFRTNYIVVVIPGKLIQFGSKQHPQETHVSYWTTQDFAGMEIKIKRNDRKAIVSIAGFFSQPDATILDADIEIAAKHGVARY